jgi:hypothetical protein
MFMFTRFRIPLPPPATDPSSPAFLIDSEDYVRRIWSNYDRRANEHRRYYRASGILIIVAGALLPLLTTLNYSHKSLVISAVGVSISAVTALRAFYRWDHMWALLRATEFSLSDTYWKWRGEVGEARGTEGAAIPAQSRDATIRMLDEVSDIRRNEAMSFFKNLPFPHKQ